MDEPRRMGRAERAGNLDGRAEGFVEAHGSLFEPRRQSLALQVLHDEEVDAILMTNVMQRAYVRVGQLRDRARLVVEALPELRICSERRRQNLDRDEAIETRINRPVNLSHP